MDFLDNTNNSNVLFQKPRSSSSARDAACPPNDFTVGSHHFNEMACGHGLHAIDHAGDVKARPANLRGFSQPQDPKTHDCNSGLMITLSRSQTSPNIFQGRSGKPIKREFPFRLSSFEDPFLFNEPQQDEVHSHVQHSISDEILVTRPSQMRSKSLGPLTPPDELDAPQHTLYHTELASHPGHDRTDPLPIVETISQASESVNTPRLNLGMTNQELHTVVGQTSLCAPWLLRALGIASRHPSVRRSAPCTNDLTGGPFDRTDIYCTKEIVSQVLPCHATDRRSIKTYELACDYLDQVLSTPLLTVTHVRAVKQGRSLDDFPKSPPVTPSFSGRESYFEVQGSSQTEHQNMYTNLARVPVYHEVAASNALHTTATQRNVMGAKANLIVLERYIPPTSRAEVEDFFNAMSDRSYLADRLNELSIGAGSLLLVYPTQRGSRTFQKRFLAPIIDPMVLGMTITHGLTAAVAETIATMASVEAMMDMKQMEDKIFQLCEVVASRSSSRLPSNKFVIAHSEAVEVALDRDTWVNWFVEQEQPRIKDALIQYHKQGGRVPQVSMRNEEITASMIVREITEGIQKSTKEAGNVPIEVGVLVIRRLKK